MIQLTDEQFDEIRQIIMAAQTVVRSGYMNIDKTEDFTDHLLIDREGFDSLEKALKDFDNGN